MSKTKEAILDAAERRIRAFGYNGFSFRDIAADVGIKSASVHHHFPTKGDLAAAVANRYRVRFFETLGNRNEAPDWTAAFRQALVEDDQLCLCGTLAANRDALPEEVAAAARRFFEDSIERIRVASGSRNSALRILATLEGAMILSRSLDDIAAFDAATSNLPNA